MNCATECVRRTGIFIIVLLIIPGVLAAQQFRVEGDLGFNLFSLSDPVFESSLDTGENVEADLSHGTGLSFGAYGGIDVGGIEIGGEFFYAKSDGDTSDLSFDGVTDPDTAGSYDFSYFKIGPQFRYYFESANPQVEPFFGGALSYVGATVDIDDPALKVKQGYLDIGILGGATYWVQENFYVGGVGRIDYFAQIKDDSLSGIEVQPGTFADFNEITTSGWMPFSIFFIVGTRL